MWNKKDKTFLAIVLIIGLILMFSQLGGRFLWGDEAQNSLFSLNTLRFGIPTFYDGEKLIVDNHLRLEENFWLSDRLTDWKPNQEFNKWDQALKWQAWLPFYISAFFFSVFGTSDFVARLPFAIFGLAILVTRVF